MIVTKGTLLGPYEIFAHIGTGGMGDVWRARDKRIGRDVAIKILPEFAAGEEQVRRFEQEARAAGALNHPGLVTIFDVGRTDGARGSPYIVMEMLEGETLRQAIGDSVPAPLPPKKAIGYAVQIASALAVAHEKGIIHRDLKPENIFITSEGRVKILDFGLAKLAEAAKDEVLEKSGRHLTSTGMVVGTPGYMSPEQVRAKPLDHRTDIFSLGAVIYEMVSGRRAFEGDSAVETMTAVLNEEPEPLPAIAPKAPAALDAIVRHCLEKNPRERFQSALDLAFQLRLLPEFQNSVTDSVKALPRVAEATRLPVRAGIAVLSLLALAGAGFVLLRARGNGQQAAFHSFKQLTFAEDLTMFPTLSPDGKTVVYVSSRSGNRDIYVQRVDGRVATNLTADSPADDSEPAFSPDGSSIAFRSEREGGGIFIMSVTGESPHRVTDFGHNPSWSPDSKRVVVSTQPTSLRPNIRPNRGELWIVDVHSGAKRPLLRLPDARQSDGLQPSWSPSGKRIAFWGVSKNTGQRDIWTIAPDAPEPLKTIVRVTSDPALHWNPVWSPDGKYLYFGSDRSGSLNLWRVPIREATGQPAGSPQPMMLPAPVSGDFAFSQDGTLAYGTVTRTFRLSACPFDEKGGQIGAPRQLFGGTLELLSFEPSPDRRFIAFTTSGGQEDVFVVNADGTHLVQLTNDLAKDRGVTWAPDGKTLYLFSDRGGSYNIWSIRADGSKLMPLTDKPTLNRVLDSRSISSPNASPDGRTLAAIAKTDTATLVHLDRPMPQRPESLGFSADVLRWSPDGNQLLAVVKDGIGIYSLQTRHFEKVLDRGTDAQWLPDGKHILFFDKSGPSVLDLDSRRVTRPASPPGLAWNDPTLGRRLSRDGTTLYLRQMLEQGDVWIARFDSPAPQSSAAEAP